VLGPQRDAVIQLCRHNARSDSVGFGYTKEIWDKNTVNLVTWSLPSEYQRAEPLHAYSPIRGICRSRCRLSTGLGSTTVFVPPSPFVQRTPSFLVALVRLVFTGGHGRMFVLTQPFTTKRHGHLSTEAVKHYLVIFAGAMFFIHIFAWTLLPILTLGQLMFMCPTGRKNLKCCQGVPNQPKS
jgi:hypothetical protein